MPFLHYFMIGIISIMHQHFPTQVCCVNARAYRSNGTDMLSLLAFKAQVTRDPMASLSSWNTSLHFCQWNGVKCGKKHQRVTFLDLQSQLLTGYISPAIGNLSFLRVLDLANNSFQGAIPSELGYLVRLEKLNLILKAFRVTNFRNLSGWSNLRLLYLGGNNFMGQVPSQIRSLSRLTELVISDNNFSGLVPAWFGNLTSLKELYASENMFRGPIPEQIGRLKGLNICNFELNDRLSGALPSTIYNLSQLTVLSFAKNSLSGVLPSDMFLSLPNLKKLLLGINNFSGIIPVSISNASNLELVSLTENRFFGTIPVTFQSPKLRKLGLSLNNLGSRDANDLDFITSLTNCSLLRHIEMAGNNLGGSLPASFGKLSTKLQFIFAGGNRISGNIPASIGNLTGLVGVDLSYNQLIGSIPVAVGSLQKLQLLYLGGNRLFGEIPYSVRNLTSIIELLLQENSLEGSIPASLGNCINLISLRLDKNELNGSIPSQLMSLSSLSKSLNLSHNHLSGPLPSEIGGLLNLVELDVSENKLSGEIPSTLGSCVSFQLLHLDVNFFHGTISSTWKALRGLDELNISHNNLSGKLLKDLSELPFLQRLDLSYNNFEGEVPTKGVFSNSSQISLFGNQGLCGGIPDLRLPTCSTMKQGKAPLSLALKVVVSVISGLLGFLFVLILLWTWFCKKRKQPPVEPALCGKPRSVSFNDLLKATNGFSADNFVRMGGFGSVYKGILEPDQTIVAVKVLNLEKREASKSFVRECEVLRNIKHKNLVKVIAACSSLDHQGNDFKAIVYEFMPNGNLETWIHTDPEAGDEIEKSKILNLSQRLNIAIDVVTAFDYLHYQCESPIIDCDLKPSNILLHDQMIAHVSDFGLAKIVAPSNFHISSYQINSSSGIKGTIGYAAPEYGLGSAATILGDVYSFGILLLEIFTAKRPTDDIFKEGLDIHRLAEMSLSKGVMNIIEQNLIPIEEEASRRYHKRRTSSCNVREIFSSIIKVGVLCSEESPRDRMNIHEALKELCTLKKLVS